MKLLQPLHHYHKNYHISECNIVSVKLVWLVLRKNFEKEKVRAHLPIEFTT